MRLTLTTLIAPLALTLAAACGDSSDPAPEAAPTSDLPESFYLATAPDGAVDVGSAHATAVDGAAVVVRGVVGGSPAPFVEGLAAFTIVDPVLESCEGDGMNCPTPWDYCCVDPGTIAAQSATIELRDGDAVLSASPRGFHGLDHLVSVVVTGTAERDEQGNLTVIATGLYPEI